MLARFKMGLLGLVFSLSAGVAAAQQKSFTLVVAPELSGSGLLDYMLPRFALKTGIRPQVVVRDADGAESGEDVLLVARSDIAGAADTARVFDDAEGRAYHLTLTGQAGEGAAHGASFAEWLRSDVGQKTVAAYAPDGAALFTATAGQVETVEQIVYPGDPARGAELSQLHCGRCHVVDPAKRYGSLGSTPSFGALKAMADWDYRFQAFYALNPHPSFTLIDGVTPDFDETRPPPIVPVRLTLDELDHILAFVAGMAAADLGAPVQSR
ncbi:hypothetical protein HMH01_07970 [Halovulum dunhuangense]|uniref:Cytochrome c domain-containing protein n=1 Tax=Halovulum dunhuangense TaxID=1505036 RepID=A0A849L2C8_9RHOB|nr:c-type cytochrome [Halovulum dunhuangense]NNU80377.1 hypothetical protein [Halovulum dunhuangense]